jgi:hypothetical protein
VANTRPWSAALLASLAACSAPPRAASPPASDEIVQVPGLDGTLTAPEAVAINTFVAVSTTGPLDHATLVALWDQGGPAVAALAAEYGRTSKSSHLARWTWVYTASRTEHADALGFLAGVIREPIPPATATDPHLGGARFEEQLIHQAAAEGLGRLARRGRAGAAEAMRALIAETDDPAVRQALVSSYLAAAADKATASTEVKAALPAGEAWRVDVRPVAEPTSFEGAGDAQVGGP